MMKDHTSEAIARRAYELYLSRGASHGRDIDDWLEAERQLSDGNGSGPRPGSTRSTAKTRAVKSPARRRAG
jgi:Protein of unknown function (DUF2934)